MKINSIEGLEGRFEQAGKQKSVNLNRILLRSSGPMNKQIKRMKGNVKDYRDLQDIIKNIST